MTMGFEGDGDPPIRGTGVADDSVEVAMDLEETTVSAVGKSVEKSGSTSLQKEASRSARTSTTTTTTTGMQKIDEGNEEEEEILGMKTRNWKKFNLSFAIEVNGQEGEDIRRTNYSYEGNNAKMKHHPIMSNHVLPIQS
jgi:hypothetical protein